MTPTLRYGKHCSQLEDWHDGTGLNGHNNCCQGSMARYLLETGFPWTDTVSALIAHLRLAMTGQAESSTEGYTSLSQLEAYLGMCGLTWTWNQVPTDALKPWTLLNLRGVRLRPAQYPFSWFGKDEPDHFILNVGNGLYNDPLAPNYEDTAYTDASVESAMQDGFVYLLPDPATVTWSDQKVATISTRPQKPPYVTAARYRVAVTMFLRVHPNLVSPHGPSVAKGEILEAATPPPGGDPAWNTSWRFVRSKLTGAVGQAYAPNLDAA